LGIRAGETYYFFNPESNVDSYAGLKSEFESYFTARGGFHFQPFDLGDNLEKVLSAKTSGVYLLSGGLYGQYRAKGDLDPHLVGISKGSIVQKKVLCIKGNGGLEDLKGLTVASPGSPQYVRGFLKEVFGPDKASLLDSIRILSVPKDIDALMAVNFGMANASLTSESSLQKLALINPAQSSALKTLGQSSESFLLVASLPRQGDRLTGEMMEALERMSLDPEGVKDLKMIGLDGWKRIEALPPSAQKLLRVP
jgi:hypothetical protein